MLHDLRLSEEARLDIITDTSNNWISYRNMDNTLPDAHFRIFGNIYQGSTTRNARFRIFGNMYNTAFHHALFPGYLAILIRTAHNILQYLFGQRSIGWTFPNSRQHSLNHCLPWCPFLAIWQTFTKQLYSYRIDIHMSCHLFIFKTWHFGSNIWLLIGAWWRHMAT